MNHPHLTKSIKSILLRRLPSLNNKLLYVLMPGKCELTTSEIITNGHVSLFLEVVENIKHMPETDPYCFKYPLNAAIKYGYIDMVKNLFLIGCKCLTLNLAPMCVINDGNLEMIQYLRECGIHCDEESADNAAEMGYLDIIQDLHQNGISCTECGADNAAGNGHFEVVQYLHQNKIYCTDQGANDAASGGYFKIVQLLHNDGIDCDVFLANSLACKKDNLNMIQYLRSIGVHCTSKGADYAAFKGNLEIVQDLRKHGIHCTKQGLEWAQKRGRLAIVQDLQVNEPELFK